MRALLLDTQSLQQAGQADTATIEMSNMAATPRRISQIGSETWESTAAVTHTSENVKSARVMVQVAVNKKEGAVRMVAPGLRTQ